jgi:Tol biopolymer transport system component
MKYPAKSVHVVLGIACCISSFPQPVLGAKVYLDQKPPGLKPEVFAPGVVSTADEHEFGSAWSRAGEELFYGVDLGDRTEIRRVRLDEHQRPRTETVISHERYSFNDPFVTENGRKLFYISDRPVDGRGATKDYDIWYSERRETGWSDPVHAGTEINSDRDEYFVSLSRDGSMYFASNSKAAPERGRDFDIYMARQVDGVFHKPTRLSDAVNSRDYEADVFVASDGSYLIFCAIRADGLGRGDLYISFKNEKDEWMPAKNMGPIINTEGHELCPFVTSDGKFLFYTSNKDIYWVDAKILERFR